MVCWARLAGEPAGGGVAARLRDVLPRLNPGVPARALELAEEELVRERGALIPERANQEIYSLMKDGVKVSYRDDQGTMPP